MAEEPRQLVFDMPHRPALGAEDFLVSDANSAAVELIDAWPDWPHWGALVVGPEASGKSHLANVWRYRSQAVFYQADVLDEGAVGALRESRALVVDDVDRGLASERVLFHLLNLARQESYSVLLTSREAPGGLSVVLPDLRSRLQALPLAHLAAPDEMLLQGLLVKLFADRQLDVAPPVIAYLLTRMERSMGAANRVVEAIDNLALQSHRNVTRPLAQQALRLLNHDP